MFSEIIIALVLGIITGIITGLTPGIHINLVSLLVLSFSPFLLQITSPVVLGVYIISLAIVHTFLDALPSIYLGAPDEAQALNVLPGHRLLLKGEGHNAILYTVIGALGCLLLGVLLLPLFLISMRIIDPFIQPIIGYALLLIMVYMIGKEKKWLYCFAAFLLSGVLGLLVFSIPSLNQPLFPLLSGLFGISLLIVSLMETTKIPPQNITGDMTVSVKNMSKAIGAGTGVGFLAAFLPGFGSSQAAIIAMNIVGKIGDEAFLILVGGINTANMFISIGTAYILDKARNGAIVVVKELLGTMNFEAMIILVGASLLAGGVAVILTIVISKSFARWIVKINYQRLIISIIAFITLLTLYFDGVIGFIILLSATAVGLIVAHWGIGKNHLLGCLILPVILYFVL